MAGPGGIGLGKRPATVSDSWEGTESECYQARVQSSRPAKPGFLQTSAGPGGACLTPARSGLVLNSFSSCGSGDGTSAGIHLGSRTDSLLTGLQCGVGVV